MSNSVTVDMKASIYVGFTFEIDLEDYDLENGTVYSIRKDIEYQLKDRIGSEVERMNGYQYEDEIRAYIEENSSGDELDEAILQAIEKTNAENEEE